MCSSFQDSFEFYLPASLQHTHDHEPNDSQKWYI